MKRKDLEQLRALHQELRTLEERYIVTPKAEEVGDSYGDYTHGFKQIKIIQGMSSTRADKLRDKLEHKFDLLSMRIEKMEEFLEAVDDSEMRDILRLYYANGLSQEEIGKRKRYSRSAITRKIDRFWERQL